MCQPECNPLIYNVTLTTQDGTLNADILLTNQFIAMMAAGAFNASQGYTSSSDTTFSLSFQGLLSNIN